MCVNSIEKHTRWWAITTSNCYGWTSIFYYHSKLLCGIFTTLPYHWYCTSQTYGRLNFNASFLKWEFFQFLQVQPSYSTMSTSHRMIKLLLFNPAQVLEELHFGWLSGITFHSTDLVSLLLSCISWGSARLGQDLYASVAWSRLLCLFTVILEKISMEIWKRKKKSRQYAENSRS